MDAWSSLDVPMRVIGVGPLLDTVKNSGLDSIVCRGWCLPEEVADEMRSASFLIMPSEWYETFGLVIAEAYSQCLPVIVSRLGAMAEIVEDGVTGLHFAPGDAADLASKVRWAVENPEKMRQMGLNARRVYERDYTPEANYPQLMAIYEEVIKANRSNA